MSDPNTLLQLRMLYVGLNNIPGAQFEDEINPILVNPDDVIPPKYDNTDQNRFPKSESVSFQDWTQTDKIN